MNILNRIHKLIWLALIIAIIFTAACDKAPPVKFQCQDAIGCVDIKPGDPIKIGVLQALSGKVSTIGEDQVRGIKLALDARNGRVAGHPVLLQIEDTGCSGEGGANAALKIIADPDQTAILGTTCSGAAATAAKIMSDAGMSMVSGNNSAAFLTTVANKRAVNWQNGYFRTAPNEEYAGRTAALYAFKKLKIHRAATINDGDIYTKGLTDGFIQAFKELGGEVVLDTSVNKDEDLMRPVLTAVINAKAELLFFPLFQPEGNFVLTLARQLPEFSKISLISGGALIDKSFLEDVGTAGNGMYFVGPSLITVSDDNRQLARKYRNKYQTIPSTSYYLSAYDAANLLFTALEDSVIKEADGTLHIGRQTLRDTLYKTKNFNGVSGTLSCNKFGDCATPSFDVLRLEEPAAGVNGLQKNVIFSYSPMKD